ncbi:hypothetical protein D3C71_1249370 [compost metagenome]
MDDIDIFAQYAHIMELFYLTFVGIHTRRGVDNNAHTQFSGIVPVFLYFGIFYRTAAQVHTNFLVFFVFCHKLKQPLDLSKIGRVAFFQIPMVTIQKLPAHVHFSECIKACLRMLKGPCVMIKIANGSDSRINSFRQ